MAGIGNLKFKAIIATDSRGRKFEDFVTPNAHVCDTMNIVKRGARVNNIGEA